MPNEVELPEQAIRIAIGQAKAMIVTLEEPVTGGVAGWDMRWRLRTRSGTLLVTKSSGAGISIVEDGVDGIALPSWRIDLVAADTGDLDPGPLDWSLWDRLANQENPIARGTAHVFRTADLPEPPP
jgi:hypothetical protein